MFSPVAVILSLLALSASTSALVAPRATPPKGWNTAALEPYDTYHTRYLALKCNVKHNTKFFEDCCRPMLVKQKLSSRPAQCTPKGSTNVNIDDQDCYDDDDDIPAAPAPAPPKPKPTTTSTTKAPVKTPAPPITQKVNTPAPKPPTPNANDASLNKGGFATFYYQNGNAGACGKYHGDNDMIAAIDHERYGDLGKQSSLCGKKVTLTNTNNNKSVTVTIADACPTCDNSNSIDLSVGAFKAIAPLADGHVPITWKFV